MKQRTNYLVLTSAFAFLLSACGAKPRPETPVPQAAPVTAALPGPSAPMEDAGAASTSAATNDAARRREAAERARAVLGQKIFFAYDRADLSAEARRLLDAKVATLRTASAVTLTIAGHADERGSDEYNLALGNRRANAVRQYLTLHGVRVDRLKTVSYGEEQPATDGHDEASWAQNRRAEFLVTAGLE